MTMLRTESTKTFKLKDFTTKNIIFLKPTSLKGTTRFSKFFSETYSAAICNVL